MDTPEGRGTVVEADLLRQRVKVRMEDSPETISVFANADIAILRSGKAKKNDPPIPADLAPISGGGKRVRREPEEEALILEPIRFRYSEEKVIEEPEEPREYAPEPEEKSQEKPGRSRRRKKSGENKGENPEKKEKPQKKEPPKAAEKKEEKKDAPQKKKGNGPKHKKEEAAPRKEAEEAAPRKEAGEAAPEQTKKPRRRPNYRRKKSPKPQE